MDSSSGASSDVDVTFHFDRSKCLGWTVFGFVLTIGCITLAVLAEDQRFLGGLLPGRLFGSLGAVLFLAMGSSWLSRLLHSGPALVLTESGIATDKRLGGFVTPRVVGVIPWIDIESVAAGAHGSIVLQLRDPDKFWAAQSIVSKLLAWHPAPGRRALVSLGGNDLSGDQLEIVTIIKSRAEVDPLTRPSGDSLPPF